MNLKRFSVLVTVLLVVATFYGCDDETTATQNTKQVSSGQPTPIQGVHTVKRGEYLIKIAQQYPNVSWEAILLLNEDTLQARYDKTCGSKPKSYTDRRGRRGLFCNNRYNRPYGNTLVPGWVLRIPVGQAPVAIEQAVQEIEGDKVAIVIDDTGSMSEDRQTVGNFYSAAVNQYGKKIVGVWLYADSTVRRYNRGNVEFQVTGGQENTYHALREAAKARPDAIILITDEPGDDWEWRAVKNLPPVIFHCLDYCQMEADSVAKLTGGRAMTGVPTLARN